MDLFDFQGFVGQDKVPQKLSHRQDRTEIFASFICKEVVCFARRLQYID